MMNTNYLLSILFVLSSMSAVGAPQVGGAPLTFELATVQQNGIDAVLDVGILAIGGPYETLLSVRNDSAKAMTVDAFSLGDGVLALWEPVGGVISTRIELAAKSQHNLRVKVAALSGPQNHPAVVFMQEWNEIARLDLLFTKVDITQPSEVNFGNVKSGMGREGATYRFCTPPPPVGFFISRAIPVVTEAAGNKDDFRGCASWASCAVDVAKAGEGDCFSVWVQGHSEGDDHAHDRTVLVNFKVQVTYQANQPVWTLGNAKSYVKPSSGPK
jgi:hypothetical protein